MTNDIKQRIEQINRGEVPQGYKKTEVGIVPQEWEDKTIGQIGKFSKGKGIPGTEMKSEGLPCIGYGDIYTKYSYKFDKTYNFVDDEIAKESTKAEKGAIFFTCSGETAIEIGKCVCYTGDEPIYVGGDIAILKTNKQVDPLFLAYQQNIPASITKKAQYGQGHSVVHIYSDSLSKLCVAYPKELNEQQNIAEILAKWDEAIELQEKLIAKLEEQKKALMQKLLTPKEGWRKYKIKHFMKIKDIRQTPSDLAPLFAFVANIGIADKGEKYDRSALVKNKNKMYKRTDLNDFIYSSNNLDVGSIGLNQYGTVVISDVYEIFEIKSNAIPIVISQIIQSPEILYKILQFRQGALYGQYRIHAKDFLSVEISMPTFEEQSDIACILSTSERQLNLMGEKLQKLKQQQKALQQLLLTGIVRV